MCALCVIFNEFEYFDYAFGLSPQTLRVATSDLPLRKFCFIFIVDVLDDFNRSVFTRIFYLSNIH